MPSEKILVRLDPTSATAFSHCEREFYNTNRLGLVPKIANKYFAFGGAFHKARAMLRNGKPLDQAMEAGIRQYAEANCTKMPPRSLQDLANAIQEWYARYVETVDLLQPIETASGKEAIELPFAMPFWSTEKVDVLLCGVIDELSKRQDFPDIIVTDCKTTSSTNRQEYLKSYATSPQMSIYAWVVKQMFSMRDYPGLIIDGVFLSKTMSIICSRNIEVIKLDPVIIERVMTRILRIAKVIAERIEKGEEFEYEFNSCTQKYDACPYIDICPYPQASQDMLIGTMFSKREYNPATFND